MKARAAAGSGSEVPAWQDLRLSVASSGVSMQVPLSMPALTTTSMQVPLSMPALAMTSMQVPLSMPRLATTSMQVPLSLPAQATTSTSTQARALAVMSGSDVPTSMRVAPTSVVSIAAAPSPIPIATSTPTPAVAALVPATNAGFGRSEAALGLIVAVLLAVGLAFHRRRASARLRTVVGPRFAKLTPERSEGRLVLAHRLGVVGLAFGVLAWMQPRFGVDERGGRPPTANLCLCLDVSRSMLASDLRPTRLAFAQGAIAELGQRARGDRAALVLFAGEARLRVPRTNDFDSLVEIARAVDPADVPLGGTDLAAAIDAGVRALASSRAGADTPERRLDGAILLVTDGEDPTGAGREAAARARARGVPVHCIGVGTALGSKITVRGADGRESFLRDRAGNEVVTRLQAASLRALVEAGGGVYVDAAGARAPLVEAYERGVLPELARRAAARDRETDGDSVVGGGGETGGVEDVGAQSLGLGAHRFQLPLVVALVLLILEYGLAQRRRVPAGGGE